MNNPDAKQLIMAAYSGDINAVKLAIAAKVNLDAVDKNGLTALHYAAMGGYKDVVISLLTQGASPYIKDKYGKTAAHLAKSKHHGQIVSIFMNKETETLIKFVRANDLEAVERWILLGLGINEKTENGTTPLMWAIHDDVPAIFDVLLQSGADVESRLNTGDTALTLAADSGNFFAVDELIRAGADIDVMTNEGGYALFFAAKKGCIHIVKVLLYNKANPNLLTRQNITTLFGAVEGEHYDVAEILLENGADANLGGFSPALIDSCDFTCLGLATWKSNISLVNLLLRYKANPNAKMARGYTALNIAAIMGYADILNTLLRNGGDVNAETFNGATPEIVQLLRLHSANLPPANEQKENMSEDKVMIGKITPNKMMVEDIKAEKEQKTQHQQKSVHAPELQPLLAKLNHLTGLQSVKADISQFVNFLRFQQLRKSKGLSVPEQSLHMVFTGNPGTGKTTIARLVSQIYKSMGILTEGQFVETDRAGLIGGYLGQTALKTQEVVQSAIGGILFIDEAYSLTDNTSGHDQYGQEAVSTLLKLMEDHRDDLIVKIGRAHV